MKNTWFFLVLCWAMVSLLITGNSCKKTTVTVTKTDTLVHAWQQAPYYNVVGQQALGLASLNDSVLMVAGSSMITQISQPNFYMYSNFLPGASSYYPVLGVPFVDDQVVSYCNGTSLFASSSIHFDSYSTVQYTPVYTSGSSNLMGSLNPPIPTLQSPAAAWPMLAHRYMITPVETYPNDFSTTRFDLVQFNTDKLLASVHFWYDTAVATPVYIHPATGTIGWSSSGYFCSVYYDKFFFSYGGQFYRMDTTGDVKAFGYMTPGGNGATIEGMFTYGDTLFAKGGGKFYASLDKGETWSLFNDYGMYIGVGSMIFRNVGKDLYTTEPTLDMQIWKVDIEGNNFAFNELNNDGLQYYLVTGLAKCGRYVFASTTAGVFYRDTALFNQTKNPVRL